MGEIILGNGMTNTNLTLSEKWLSSYCFKELVVSLREKGYYASTLGILKGNACINLHLFGTANSHAAKQY